MAPRRLDPCADRDGAGDLRHPRLADRGCHARLAAGPRGRRRVQRAAGLPLSFWGAALAHIGVGVTLLGLAGVGFGAEAITTLHKGVPQTVGPYEITLDSVGERVGPNYKETVATMTVRSGDAVVAHDRAGAPAVRRARR